MNGVEIPLPDGMFIEDKEGSVRNKMRIAWWRNARTSTYRELSIPYSLEAPDTLAPTALEIPFEQYDASQPPVVVGHYWLPGDLVPVPLAPNVACVDYSAAKGGPLVAYCWSGERELRQDHFVRHAE